MNKLFTLFASVGLLYSCTKEAPLVQTPPQLNAESSYSSSDSVYEGTIRFHFTAEVAPFEEVVGGLDEAQQARGISTTINTHEVATRQFINLRAMGDEKGTIKGFLKVYDKGTKKGASFWIDMKVSEDGKTVSYDGLFDRYTGPEAEELKAMLSSNLKDVYASIIIGSKGQNTPFDNKGAYSFVWQNGAQLPADFVMLKSEENKLEVRTDEETKHRDVIFKDKESIKLKLQGYLMILQFHNSFPKYALKPDVPANLGSASRSTTPSLQARELERVERPPLKVKLVFTSDLYSLQISHSYTRRCCRFVRGGSLASHVYQAMVDGSSPTIWSTLQGEMNTPRGTLKSIAIWRLLKLQASPWLSKCLCPLSLRPLSIQA